MSPARIRWRNFGPRIFTPIFSHASLEAGASVDRVNGCDGEVKYSAEGNPAAEDSLLTDYESL